MTSCVSNQRASQALRTRICRNANDFRAVTEVRFAQGNYLRELFLSPRVGISHLLPPRPPLYRTLGPISKPSGHSHEKACV